MTNKEALEECKSRLVCKYGVSAQTLSQDFWGKCVEALEKQSRYDKLMQIVVDSECMVDWACCDLTENIIEENGESWCTNHCTNFRKECVEKWIDWSDGND